MSGGELDIFEIERFAIHDGPGIRTTVFFQGCPLKCEWCANPESQTVGSHIMSFSRLCTGCGKCARICGEKAIHILNGKSEIDRHKCISCGKCAVICPNNAMKVSGRKISSAELLKTVLRDMDYYQSSGGGVTLSGGEALLRINALIPFLTECHRHSVHIAAETCGHVSVETIETAMKYIDLFLFDIKSLDGEKFKRFTGGELNVAKGSFEALCASCPKKVIVRVPVIPDFNDGEIAAIMEYARKNGVAELHLLPYHTLGISKYEQLGREYNFPCRESLNENLLIPNAEIGAKLGLKVKIGG